jgi:hypothetical protein
VTIQDGGMDFISNGHIAFGHPKKSIIYIKKDGYIFIGPSSGKNFGYDDVEDIIYMLHNGSKVTLGQHGNQKEQGIQLISKTGGPTLSVLDKDIVFTVPNKKGDYQISIAPDKDYLKITKEKSVINLEGKNIEIESKGDIRFTINNDKEFGYSAKRDFIFLYHNKAYITVGTQTSPKGKNYIGVSINSPNGNEFRISDEGILAGVPGKIGPEDDYKISIAKDKFVQLRKGKSIIKMEGDNIKIEAVGDINITSKNGNVNINGKKVSLNE